MTPTAYGMRLQIVRKDEKRHTIYGWAYVSQDADGVQVVDHSDETIAIETLEKAMHGFMKSSRASGEGHDGRDYGNVVVECIVFTKEKIAAMGLEEGSVPLGCWIGVEVGPETFAKVVSGELSMFSIEGWADKVAA
jgi:hypothetical protein